MYDSSLIARTRSGTLPRYTQRPTTVLLGYCTSTPNTEIGDKRTYYYDKHTITQVMSDIQHTQSWITSSRVAYHLQCIRETG